MPYETPPVSVIERLSVGSDRPLTMLCPSCGDTMKHSRTIAKFGVRLERLIFVCPSCKGVDSKELRQVA
jgi:Transcription factor zinc-finger